MLETTNKAKGRHIDGTKTMGSSLEAPIRNDTIVGTLRPNSKSRARDLAERDNAGPIPLRKALLRLCTNGFVIAGSERAPRCRGGGSRT